MPAPLAYLITWTTHGTWLPGDERGWIQRGIDGIRDFDERLNEKAKEITKNVVYLTVDHRNIVEGAIRQHCQYREWNLRAINVRTNHVHVIVTASVRPELVMGQLKARSSRMLNEQISTSSGTDAARWWTRHGSTKWINDPDYLSNAIRYVVEGQDYS